MIRDAWLQSSWFGASARIVGGILLVGFSISSAAAAEAQKEFLRALRENGYGEMALEYIDRLEKRTDVPADLKETLDLERGFAFRVAANESYNNEQRTARLADSEKFIDQFIKTHPAHPASAAALVEWGGYGLEVAQRAISQAENTKDAAQKTKLLADATGALNQCVPRLEAASKLMEKQRPPLEAAAKNNQKKSLDELADLDYSLLELRFKRAIANFFQAQLMPAEKAKERKELLTAVSKTFDDIYQNNRENVAGLMSHMWDGRASQELGKDQLAQDIYDEVLANAPDNPQAVAATPRAAAELFSQVIMYRLRLMAKKDPTAAILEAKEWLIGHNKWKGASSYQGVAFEVVKAQIAQAEKLAGEKKRNAMREIINVLNDMAKTPSPYQDDVIALKKSITQTEGTESDSIDENVVLGKSAMDSGNVAEAESYFEKAANLARTAKLPAEAKKLPEVMKELNNAHYRRALQLYNEGKLEEALKKAETLARESPDDAVAPAAMGAAMSTQLMLYVKAKDKAPELKHLEEMAKFMFDHWPNRPEADEARFALGQANLVKGEIPAGMEILKKINPQSRRYPQVLHYLGQASWKVYIDERKKPATERKEATMKAALGEARDNLTKSLELQRKAATTEGGSDSSNDTALLLADVSSEAQDYKTALALYQPLLDGLVKSAAEKKPEGLDNSTLRICMGLFKANLAQNNLIGAATVGQSLAKIAPDAPQANAFVIDNIKTLMGKVKELEVNLKDARESNEPGVADMQKNLDAAKDAYGKMVAEAAGRQQISIAAMLLLADAYTSVQKTDEASEVYKKILSRAESDPEFKKQAEKIIIPIRAKLVGILREKGEYKAALTQIEGLIAANPKTLEPLMEKGRILQNFAERDPKQYPAATAHWTEVRVMLSRVTNRPPEFFEVVHNAAFCILGEARQIGDKAAREEKALIAEKLLKSTMFTEPNLSGPDMIAKYKSLLAQSGLIRGVKPAVKPAAAASTTSATAK